ncbi:hypothetical protein BY458DRAFT_549223 [Sporodiniella umbellata]|nr:hypothetical protein BY458DRAFT_549223 [Sporodiniella umbellata]
MVESREIQRVPSFIQFQPESPNESENTGNNANRFHPSGRPKRKSVFKPSKYQAQFFEDDEEPRKKKSTEKDLSNDNNKRETKRAKEEVWIGAANEHGRGAYVFYFGEQDSRNKSIVCDKNVHFFDANEIYTTAIADILERKPLFKKSLVIYHGSRDLVLDVNGGSEDANASIIERIQLLLKKSEPNIQVRRLTSRKTAEEHIIADKLAADILRETIEQEKNLQRNEMEIIDDQKENKDIEEKETEDTDMITLEEATVVTEEITIKIVEQTTQSKGEKPLQGSMYELSQDSLESLMEEPMQIFENGSKESTQESSQNSIQKPSEKVDIKDQPVLVRESSISSLLGSLWNTLSYPFKTKK